MKEFDNSSQRFTSEFHYQDAKGKSRRAPNYADSSVEERARELGDPWKTDYSLFYSLASMHAHGAPGAVFQGHFTSNAKSPQQREEDSTGFIAYFSMRILMNALRLLARNGFIVDIQPAESVFADALTFAK